LKNLQKIYQELKTEEKGNSAPQENTDGKIVVGGNAKIVMTQEQFEKLKQEVAKVRNKITKNN
jgi:hypothetical protein